MGSTRDHTICAVGVVAAIGLTLAACTGREDGDASEDMATDAPAATMSVSEEPASIDDAGAPAVAPAAGAEIAEERVDADGGGVGGVGGLVLPDDAELAISASAQLRVDDVRRAVDQVRTAVAGAGGRVASATIAYPDDGGGGDDVTSPPNEQAYASLTLLIPPEALGGVIDRLEDLGELARFDQLAEDVTDQLADLDTRIANARASVERSRELLDQATNLQDLVFLESELTRRETDLELLLAQQQGLEDRVAMSTLTLEITEVDAAPDESDGGGIVDALGDGWRAFATGVMALVVALAAAAPFLLAATLALVVFASVRRRRRQGASAEAVRAEHPVGDAAVGEGEGRPEAGVGVGVGERERP